MPGTAGAQAPVETPAGQDPAAVAAQVAQLTGRWQAVVADIAATEPELIGAEDALTSAERRAADSRADLAGLRMEEEHARLAHAAASERADAAANRLTWTVRQLDLADLALSQQEDLIVEHAVLVYKHGSTLRLGVVDSLLRSRSSSELVTNLSMLERVGDHERAILEGLEVKRARVDELQREAVNAWAVAATELAVARRASEVLGELTVEQQSTAASAAGQRRAALAAAGSARRKVAALRSERTALEQQLAALGVTPVAPAEAAADPSPVDRAPRRTSWPRPRRFPPVLGYRCPVPGGTFLNDWGFPRPGGRTHEGTDVFARRGTPILAVADGTVTNVDRTDTWGGEAAGGDLGGITVSLRTGEDERWYFAHLDRVAPGIEEGVEVTAAQPLGSVGDSGNARGTPPHLHLSRFVGDIAANPYHALAVACADEG